MKLTTLLTSAFLVSFPSLAFAQPETTITTVANAEMDLLEKNFAKHLEIILPDLVKALGAPAEASNEIKSDILNAVKKEKMMTLTAAEKKLIATKANVKGFAKSQIFWKKLHKQFSSPKEAKKRRSALPILVASYLNKLNKESSTVDQLLSVRAQAIAEKQMGLKASRDRQVENFMSAKQLNLEIIASKQDNKKLIVPEKLKFTDDKGNKKDWIIKEKGAADQPCIISPETSQGKYIIVLHNGAAFMLSPEEAKAKYGVIK